jgi:DnaJ-class molecular chaperone
MPKYTYGSEHGDLIVIYEVEMPQTLSEQQKTGF